MPQDTPQALAGARTDDVERRLGDGDEPRAPGCHRVQHPVMRLDGLGAALDAGRERLEQVPRHLGVRVDDDDGVGPGFLAAPAEREVQRVTLAALGVIAALDDLRTCGARHRGGRVGAIVGHDHDVEAVRGPVEPPRARHRAFDDRLLVVRRHDDVETQLAGGSGRRSWRARQQGRHQEIRTGADGGHAQRHQDQDPRDGERAMHIRCSAIPRRSTISRGWPRP